MKEKLRVKLEEVAEQALVNAVEIFKEKKKDIQLGDVQASGCSTKYPLIPFLEEKESKIGDYIAIAVDMRNSTSHLTSYLNEGRVKYLERLFYETSVLLPVLTECIAYEKGSVVELLGDGVLGFFDCEDSDQACYASYHAARNCIEAVEDVINPLLSVRFELPPLYIGVGLAYSKTIVSIVGTEHCRMAKAFGECVYRASKLSKGKNFNNIFVSEGLKKIWPTSNHPKIKLVKLKYSEGDKDKYYYRIDEM